MGAKVTKRGTTTKTLKAALKEIKSSKAKEFYSLKKFSDDEIGKLVAALTQAKIRVLELGGGLTDRACSALATAVRGRQCPIEELQLQGNNIGDKGIQFLASAIVENPHLEKLDLSWNRIGDDGVAHLASAIKRSSLKTLDLAYNEFSDVGVAMLEEAVKDSRLKRLTLTGNARVSRLTVNNINETLAIINSERFIIAEVLCSALYIKRVGKSSLLRQLPQELIREIITALFGQRVRGNGK